MTKTNIANRHQRIAPPFAHPITPAAPSSNLPVEVSMNLLMCRSEKRHGAPLDPCFTLALNMQSLMLIAAAEVFLMSLNSNCAHPLDIMDRSDHYLVHNDVSDALIHLIPNLPTLLVFRWSCNGTWTLDWKPWIQLFPLIVRPDLHLFLLTITFIPRRFKKHILSQRQFCTRNCQFACL